MPFHSWRSIVQLVYECVYTCICEYVIVAHPTPNLYNPLLLTMSGFMVDHKLHGYNIHQASH